MFPLAALVGLTAAASRSVLVAGIYPDRPWEKPTGTDIQELERLRMEVLRVREELQQSRSELEKQQTPPGPSQGRILGKLPPERDLSNLLSLGLWVSLGAVAGHRMHTGRSVPAPQLVHKPDRPEALVRSRLPHGRRRSILSRSEPLLPTKLRRPCASCSLSREGWSRCSSSSWERWSPSAGRLALALA